MRRQKMARLRKRLGEDVPVHLVFPPTIDEDSEDEGICVVESPTLPPPKPAEVKYYDENRPLLAPGSRRSLPTHAHEEIGGVGRRSKIVGVHYTDPPMRGWESETFKGLRITCRRITTIPEE